MIEKLILKIRNIYRDISIKIRNNWHSTYKLPKHVHYFEGSLYDAIYESALKYPMNTAIEYENNQISYKQLIKRINKCAKALKSLGINKGDKITICMPNTPEEVVMFYAINEIGAVANMIHPLSSEEEIKYYLNKSKTRVMLCIDITYPKVKNIINSTNVEKVIITSATKSMEKLTSLLYWIIKGRKIGVKEDKKFILWDHFLKLANNYPSDPYESTSSADPAVILYSGGTTGKPKGVVISNYSFNTQALQSRYVSNVLIPENSFLTFLPNFHAFGIGICTHTPLFNGMKAILIPQFDSKKFKKYLRKYHFNVLCGVPTLYDYISKMTFKKNELKCLKLVVCGGDAMSIQLKQKVNAWLKEYGSTTDIKIGYGLTESSGVVALSPEGIYDRADIIGFPFPDTKFKIIDISTGKEQKRGLDGEICISGPNIMLEYLDEPEGTKNALTKEGATTWLHTGDIGYIDNIGLVHYKSRLKRMIITSGYNVYPSNIEDIIMKHESIMSCAVIGEKDETKGEIVKAFIVLKEGKNPLLTKLNLQKYLKKHLARYEQPRKIIILDELPKTRLGKISYKELENYEEEDK